MGCQPIRLKIAVVVCVDQTVNCSRGKRAVKVSPQTFRSLDRQEVQCVRQEAVRSFTVSIVCVCVFCVSLPVSKYRGNYLINGEYSGQICHDGQSLLLYKTFKFMIKSSISECLMQTNTTHNPLEINRVPVTVATPPLSFV